MVKIILKWLFIFSLMCAIIAVIPAALVALLSKVTFLAAYKTSVVLIVAFMLLLGLIKNKK